MTDLPASAPTVRLHRWLAITLIAALLLVFALLAYFAIRSKSPTYDEPLHALGAWQHLWKHDYRVNPEDPVLWQYWAALGNGPSAIKTDMTSHHFAAVADDVGDQWRYIVDQLYPGGRSLPFGSPDVPDADAFIQHSRNLMLIVSIALGVLIACWSWKLGGAVVALIATAFYALDPNIIAHAPLIKNDIALSLVTLCLSWSIWRAGQKVTAKNLLAFCLCCAAALNVKFSGVLLGPIAAILLLIRALAPAPWSVFTLTLATRFRKLLAAGAICFLAAIVSYAGIWACYGFRYGPAVDPQVRLNTDRLLKYTVVAEMTASDGHVPTTQEREGHKLGLIPRTMASLDQMHAFPQAWIFGLLYTYQSALARPTYLLGAYSYTGWWYYFPLTIFFKSSITLLVAGLIALAVAGAAIRHRAHQPFLLTTWTAICLALPPGIYLAVAMKSNLNLGLRHLLPIFPFVYIGIALAAKRLLAAKPKLFGRAIGAILLVLIPEAMLAFPDYIAYFNPIVGGSRGGLTLLGDSNLDWGQDLKLLGLWQQKHPEVQLYLIYFGSADPWTYGLQNHISFPGGYKFGPKHEVRNEPGVLAVSATMLQGVYANEDERATYDLLRHMKPIDVLGGTIYLYQWPPDRLPGK